MVSTLAHRGPDDAGIWKDESGQVVLGHRRLSIIDVSVQGHQPMLSASSRYVLVYNGEIYNFRDLRRTLESSGVHFRGASDTEVLLAAFEKWGIESTLIKANGMFAFALWDRELRQLTLARDRMGEKPLYYGLVNNTLVFASELKSIRRLPGFHARIDEDALAAFIRFGYVPTPASIYRGISKLPPGSIVTVDEHCVGQPQNYWSMGDVLQRNKGAEVEARPRALDELQELLEDAVSSRMVADVPLGAMLSGGIDSSLVVALMQKNCAAPIKTFSIGTDDVQYNEAHHAAAVAKFLGTDHVEWYISPNEARAVILTLPDVYDEPFADSSQIPTLLVSQLARRHVKVALSGDGGDELFGGYHRYRWGPRLWQMSRTVPTTVRAQLASSVLRISPATWAAVYGNMERFLPLRFRHQMPVTKLLKLADLLSANTKEELYLRMISQIRDDQIALGGNAKASARFLDPSKWPRNTDFVSWMMFIDTVSYLPDDILVKLDRASMSHSLEARVPLLDHRVVEFAWSLPRALRVNRRHGKVLLRELLYRYVPKEMVDRPKMGFSIPVGVWLRKELKDWAHNLLDPRRLRTEGYLAPDRVAHMWRDHLSGARDHQYAIWNILMFQAWLDREALSAAA